MFNDKSMGIEELEAIVFDLRQISRFYDSLIRSHSRLFDGIESRLKDLVSEKLRLEKDIADLKSFRAKFL